MLHYYLSLILSCCFYDSSPTEIYTLSLHDALPICHHVYVHSHRGVAAAAALVRDIVTAGGQAGAINFDITDTDRKSTRLNSSHTVISYAVFCLKKKTHT